jgi:hypothetical protein
MDEREWLACKDSQEMLEFLRNRGSNRKRRLFACACSRRIWKRLPDELSRRAVELAERYADGRAKKAELVEAREATLQKWGSGGRDPVPVFAASAAYCAAKSVASPRHIRDAAKSANIASGDRESAAQSNLLRCIFGNPFRPIALDSAWQTPAVVRLAQAVYDKRTLLIGNLKASRLAGLADALEEAGCNDLDILSHLRDPGPHVRGCWPVDLLLGKE